MSCLTVTWGAVSCRDGQCLSSVHPCVAGRQCNGISARLGSCSDQSKQSKFTYQCSACCIGTTSIRCVNGPPQNCYTVALLPLCSKCPSAQESGQIFRLEVIRACGNFVLEIVVTTNHLQNLSALTAARMSSRSEAFTPVTFV